MWKKTRSNATKQVVPRRVGNFVEPLSVIAEELLSHLEAIKDESGAVQDIVPEIAKWAFQGTCTVVYYSSHNRESAQSISSQAG